MFMGEALKKTEILSLEQVLHKDLDSLKRAHPEAIIFEIKKVDAIPVGFLIQEDLKNFINTHHDQDDLMIRNSTSSHWIMLYEHPAFQRRRPQLVSLDSLTPEDDTQYFILSQGQKNGPYNKNHLQSIFDKKEILLTDMVSTNGGHTWMKLYQVDGFDRRSLKESVELPEIPEHLLNESTENIIAINSLGKTYSGIVGLGKISLSRQMDNAHVHLQKSEELFLANARKSNPWHFKVLLIISLIGIGYFTYSIKNQLSSPFKKETSQLGEHNDDFQAQTLEPMGANEYQYTPPTSKKGARSVVGEQNNPTQINNEDRFNSKKLNPIRPNIKKSFMETSTFKEHQNSQHNDGNDSNYYYDDTQAMELDPVRAQVSKENYNDPELDSGNNTRAPAQENNLYEQETTN